MDRDMDLDGSLMLLRFLGPAIGVAWIVMVMLGLFVPFALYLLARWRDGKQPLPDPQLGLKIALGFFAFIGLQVLLAGSAMLVNTLISDMPSDFKGTLYRAAFGLIVPGGIMYGMHVWMLQRTNQDAFMGVRRLILGLTLIVTGIAGFTALVMSFEALFMKGSSYGMGRLAGSMLVVYGSAWIATGIRLGRLVIGDGAPPDAFVPPAPPMPVPPTQTQGGLPSLGGGSFPPIEPR
jgi:hypothetical protein